MKIIDEVIREVEESKIARHQAIADLVPVCLPLVKHDMQKATNLANMLLEPNVVLYVSDCENPMVIRALAKLHIPTKESALLQPGSVFAAIPGKGNRRVKRNDRHLSG